MCFGAHFDLNILYLGSGVLAHFLPTKLVTFLNFSLFCVTTKVGNIAGRRSEEAEADLENKVEFAVLDELDDFYENFLDHDDTEHGGFKSEVIVQQEQADEEAVAFSYEVRLFLCLQ